MGCSDLFPNRLPNAPKRRRGEDVGLEADERRELNFRRFEDFRHSAIVRRWFERGWDGITGRPQDCFESFIFIWIALNAWGESVTGRERDDELVQELAQDQILSDRFAACLREPTNPVRIAAERFREYWPIPKLQAWRNIPHAEELRPMPAERAHRLHALHIHFAPRCAIEHLETSGIIPLDWEHFLPTVYRVRCNLFHGEKDPYAQRDLDVVETALGSLAHFMRALGWFTR